MQLLLDKLDDDKEKNASYLDARCNDAGWAPIHYAVMSGSLETLELLLAAGCAVQTTTDETRTRYQKNHKRGLTARELANAFLSEHKNNNNHNNLVVCEGSALHDVSVRFQQQQQSETRRSYHDDSLRPLVERLLDVEQNGYHPPSSTILDFATSTTDDTVASTTTATTTTQRDAPRKRKKKKQQPPPPTTTTSAKPSEPSQQQQQQDPLVTALLGMGFTSEQINAAAKACGGTHRATADEMVAWIFGQQQPTPPQDNDDGQEEDDVWQSDNTNGAKKKKNEETTTQKANDLSKEKAAMAAAAAERARQERLLEEEKRRNEEKQRAERLAAKREEQRRRNREWNHKEQARQREMARAKMAQAMQTRERTAPVAASAARVTTGFPPPPPSAPKIHPSIPRIVTSGGPIKSSSSSKKNGYLGPTHHKAMKSGAMLTQPMKILTRPKGQPAPGLGPKTMAAKDTPAPPQSVAAAAATTTASGVGVVQPNQLVVGLESTNLGNGFGTDNAATAAATLSGNSFANGPVLFETDPNNALLGGFTGIPNIPPTPPPTTTTSAFQHPPSARSSTTTTTTTTTTHMSTTNNNNNNSGFARDNESFPSEVEVSKIRATAKAFVPSTFKAPPKVEPIRGGHPPPRMDWTTTSTATTATTTTTTTTTAPTTTTTSAAVYPLPTTMSGVPHELTPIGETFHGFVLPSTGMYPQHQQQQQQQQQLQLPPPLQSSRSRVVQGGVGGNGGFGGMPTNSSSPVPSAVSSITGISSLNDETTALDFTNHTTTLDSHNNNNNNNNNNVGSNYEMDGPLESTLLGGILTMEPSSRGGGDVLVVGNEQTSKRGIYNSNNIWGHDPPAAATSGGLPPIGGTELPSLMTPSVLIPPSGGTATNVVAAAASGNLDLTSAWGNPSTTNNNNNNNNNNVDATNHQLSSSIW